MINFSPTVNPGDVIAVGDIHARYDLFEKFLDHVRGTGACVILLGDIIDRGGQDVAVLNKVKELIDDPEKEGLSNFFCLMGNHEWMLLDAYDGPASSLAVWVKNGANIEELSDVYSNTGWVQNLPIYMTIGDTLFIHGGIYPGKDPLETINAGNTENLVWMRQPFLSLGPQFEKWNPELKRVVFGHTPIRSCQPYRIPGGGICIDTGAYWSDTLTSYNVTSDTFWSYDSYA
jgi:serine/threonine protein phosphatase 1